MALSAVGGPRKQIYALLFDSTITGNYQQQFDRFIAWLIILNLFALLIELVPQIHEPYRVWFDRFDVFSVVVFTLEYLLRLYTAPEDPQFRGAHRPRLAFVRNPFALVDLLAVLRFYLQAVVPLDLRFLRVLRLLRLLKLFRLLVPAWQEFRRLNRGRTFRQHVHALLYPSSYGGKLHLYFDAFIAFWVVISVCSVVLESVHAVEYLLHLELIVLDTIAVAIFTAEYCLRTYACVEDPKIFLAGGRTNPSRQVDFHGDRLPGRPALLSGGLPASPDRSAILAGLTFAAAAQIDPLYRGHDHPGQGHRA